MKRFEIPVSWIEKLSGFERELQQHGFSLDLLVRSRHWYKSEVAPVQEYLDSIYPGSVVSSAASPFEAGYKRNPKAEHEFFDSANWFFQRLCFAQQSARVYFEPPPEHESGKRFEIRCMSATSNTLYFVVYDK